MKIGRAAHKRMQMEEKIYKAGMSLFQEKGFVNTTLLEISEKAGVSKGTIFNYFASKEDILAKFGQGQAKLLKEFAEALPPSMSIKDKVITVLLEDIRGVKASEGYAKITLRGISEGGDGIYQLEMKNRQNLASVYENILKSGQLSDHLNTSLVADLIVTIYFHTLDKFINDMQPSDDGKGEAYIKEAVELLFQGVNYFSKNTNN